MFPAYRDPACGISGTWERAHNFYLEALINLGLPFILAAIIVIIGLVGVLIAASVPGARRAGCRSVFWAWW